MSNREGFLFLLVGPSGVGKNTLLNCVLDRLPDCLQMPTATTRARRPGEIEGVHHFFLSTIDFNRRIRAGHFIEWKAVHGNKYGTLRSVVEDAFRGGRDFIADVEVLGASELKHLYPHNVVQIFVTPSDSRTLDLRILEQRLRKRAPISEQELAERLGRAQFEFDSAHLCDHVLVNDHLEAATQRLLNIIKNQRTLVVAPSEELELTHAHVVNGFDLPVGVSVS
jgi:guanylate kinase